MKLALNFNGQTHQAFAYTGTKPLLTEQATLVFIHGAQHDHSVWILQSRYFAHHGYNVLAVDLPGHGKSEGSALGQVADNAAWLLALCSALKLSRCHWIGHSMGSLIALEAAAMRPEITASLALVGTAFPMRVSAALLNAAQTDEQQAFSMINFWSHSRLSPQPGAPGPGFSVFVQNRRLMERQSKGVLFTDFNACNIYNNGLVAASAITAPTTLILGANDAMTPPKAAANLAGAITHSATALIEDCGHALMAEQPHRVLQALKTHLSTTTAKAAIQVQATA